MEFNYKPDWTDKIKVLGYELKTIVDFEKGSTVYQLDIKTESRFSEIFGSRTNYLPTITLEYINSIISDEMKKHSYKLENNND